MSVEEQAPIIQKPQSQKPQSEELPPENLSAEKLPTEKPEQNKSVSVPPTLEKPGSDHNPTSQPQSPRKTLDLGSLFKKSTTTATEEAMPVSEKRNTPFSFEKLQAVWEHFAVSRKSQPLEYQLLMSRFTLKDAEISIQLENALQEGLLHTLSHDLLTFLRDELSNDHITVLGVVQEQNVEKKAYTNKEKFEQMAAKNQQLLTLQRQFGLDPDF